MILEITRIHKTPNAATLMFELSDDSRHECVLAGTDEYFVIGVQPQGGSQFHHTALFSHVPTCADVRRMIEHAAADHAADFGDVVIHTDFDFLESSEEVDAVIEEAVHIRELIISRNKS